MGKTVGKSDRGFAEREESYARKDGGENLGLRIPSSLAIGIEASAIE